MAGYNGWNLRRGSASGRRWPRGPSQIACRICDRVFMSTHALIDHIDSHTAEDIASRRRRYGLNFFLSSPADPFANPFWPLSLSGYDFASLSARGRNSIIRTTQQGMVSLRPTRLQQISLMDVDNKNIVALRQHGLRDDSIITRDCTKPFLQQLDKPVFPHGVELRKRATSDVDMLDLTLKL